MDRVNTHYGTLIGGVALILAAVLGRGWFAQQHAEFLLLVPIILGTIGFGFGAWGLISDRRAARRHREQEHAQTATIDALADLLQRGESCKSSIVLSAGFESLGYEARPWANWENDAATWIGDSAAYVEENLGGSYAAQFWSDAGLQTPEIEDPYGGLMDEHKRAFYRQIDWRCQRLAQFIEELRHSTVSRKKS